MYSNEVMVILDFPKYDWLPIIVINKGCYRNLYPLEPENVDSIGREGKIGPISDYVGMMSNLLMFLVVKL